MPPGVLLQPRLLEYTIQFVAEYEIYDTNKSGGLCGLFNYGHKKRFSKCGGKLFKRRAK